MVSKEDAKKLIDLAKKAVSDIFEGNVTDAEEYLKKNFSDNKGIFVTINKKGQLRGCMGMVDAVYPLYEGVIKLAAAAAFEDPRFPQVEKDELDDLEFELTILSERKKIDVKKPEDYLEKIKIGRDGLMIKGNLGSGLLLPQVPIEQGWGVEEFLGHVCEKAGMPSEEWKDLTNEIFAFQGEVWAEENKGIVKKELVK